MSRVFLSNEMPSKEDLQLLLLKARQSNARSATMSWDMTPLNMELTVRLSDTNAKPQWFLRSKLENSNAFKLVSCVDADIDELDKYIDPGLLSLSTPKKEKQFTKTTSSSSKARISALNLAAIVSRMRRHQKAALSFGASTLFKRRDSFILPVEQIFDVMYPG